MMTTMTTYDIDRLKQLSRSHLRKREAYERERDELAREIVAAARAGVPQKDIVQISQYTREAVRQLCMTPEQRADEKDKRRRRARKSPDTDS